MQSGTVPGIYTSWAHAVQKQGLHSQRFFSLNHKPCQRLPPPHISHPLASSAYFVLLQPNVKNRRGCSF
jgi:hypothetical protein